MIGDKKAAQASKILLQSEGREHLRDLERKLGTKLKFIHVVRNPFDNIATLALRKAKLKKNEVQDNLEVGGWLDTYISTSQYGMVLQSLWERGGERGGRGERGGGD